VVLLVDVLLAVVVHDLRMLELALHVHLLHALFFFLKLVEIGASSVLLLLDFDGK
jgi:hypothetical protein